MGAPSRSSPSPSLPGHRVTLDLVVDHPRAGPNTLHLYTLSPDGEQLSVPEAERGRTVQGAAHP